MTYRNRITDIGPGSLWVSPKGERVRVIETADHYVRFEHSAGSVLAHEREFRKAFAPLYDREKLRSQFSMSLTNLGEFTAYFSQDTGKLMARSPTCSKKWPIPPGAILIGSYAHPCSPESLFDDLNDALSALAINHAARVA